MKTARFSSDFAPCTCVQLGCHKAPFSDLCYSQSAISSAHSDCSITDSPSTSNCTLAFNDLGRGHPRRYLHVCRSSLVLVERTAAQQYQIWCYVDRYILNDQVCRRHHLGSQCFWKFSFPIVAHEIARCSHHIDANRRCDQHTSAAVSSCNWGHWGTSCQMRLVLRQLAAVLFSRSSITATRWRMAPHWQQ